MAWTRGLVAALGVKHELVRAGQYDAVVGAKGRKERRQEAAAKRKKAAAGAEKTQMIVPTKTAGEVSELIVRENKEKTSAGLTKNMSIPGPTNTRCRIRGGLRRGVGPGGDGVGAAASLTPSSRLG